MTEPDDHLGNDTIVEILAGRAPPDVRARMEAHAATCTTCRELLSALARQTDTGADTLFRAEPPEGGIVDGLDIPAHVSRYALTRIIGAGGMGIVFAAHDPELDRTVAVKLLRTDAIDPSSRSLLESRLRREARAMAKLSHPNVVTVYDVGMQGDRVFVAMELVDGVTLASWLEVPHSLADILETFHAAARGLAAAHAKGVIHRDFKPGNVLVGADGRVRVTDFGIAKVEPTASRVSTTMTAVHAAIGTPYYMAPEQFLGEPVDARADQFSLCVALYAAVHDVRPFEGETLEAIASSVLANKLVPPPDPGRVPARIHNALVRGLSVNPDDRFPSIDALLAELVIDKPRSRRSFVIGAALLGSTAIAIGAVALPLTMHASAPVVTPPAMTDAAPRSADSARPPGLAPVDAAIPADAAAPDVVDVAPDAGPRPSHPSRPRPHPTPPRHDHPVIPDVDRGD